MTITMPAPETKPAHTYADGKTALAALWHFIGREQRYVLNQLLRGEERQCFIDLLCDLAERVKNMPTVGQTDGQGDSAIVYLHYFAGGQANWYITEKDVELTSEDILDGYAHQSQAFGLADMFGRGDSDAAALGYISIAEIIGHRGELDLYWTPKPLSEITK